MRITGAREVPICLRVKDADRISNFHERHIFGSEWAETPDPPADRLLPKAHFTSPSIVWIHVLPPGVAIDPQTPTVRAEHNLIPFKHSCACLAELKSRFQLEPAVLTSLRAQLQLDTVFVNLSQSALAGCEKFAGTDVLQIVAVLERIQQCGLCFCQILPEIAQSVRR